MPGPGFTLPPVGRYAVGHIFLPRDDRLRALCERIWARIIKEQGLELLGWRSVPVDNSSMSEMVIATEPLHRQVFIACPSSILDQDDFERQVSICAQDRPPTLKLKTSYKGSLDIGHYTVSLSSRTVDLQGHVPGPPGRRPTTRT